MMPRIEPGWLCARPLAECPCTLALALYMAFDTVHPWRVGLPMQMPMSTYVQYQHVIVAVTPQDLL